MTHAIPQSTAGIERRRGKLEIGFIQLNTCIQGLTRGEDQPTTAQEHANSIEKNPQQLGKVCVAVKFRHRPHHNTQVQKIACNSKRHIFRQDFGKRSGTLKCPHAVQCEADQQTNHVAKRIGNGWADFHKKHQREYYGQANRCVYHPHHSEAKGLTQYPTHSGLRAVIRYCAPRQHHSR